MKRLHRVPPQYVSRIWWAIGVCFSCIGAALMFLLFFPYAMPERISVVIASNPIQILSILTTEHTASILRIPEDITIPGAYALGRYPISSFWKMGSLDKTDRSLLSQSIQYAFGIPIDGYIGHTYDGLYPQADSVEGIHDLFSFGNIGSLLTSRRVTNLSIIQLFTLYRSIAPIRQSDIKIIDFGQSMPTFDEALLDGTTRQVLDPQRSDVIIKNIFVYPSVRKEALSIAVVNTTAVPELAGTISRQLINSGVYVVSVDSEETAIEQCEISGSADAITSDTAAFIKKLLQCTDVISKEKMREDLRIRLGSQVGNTYRERKAKQ